MREILFRGQDAATGDWIKGFYVHLFDDKGNDSHRIYSGYAETDCEDYYPDFWEVDPETVGQFTGRVDKNGNRVFEGDIIRITAFAPNIFVGVILWDDHDQCYLIVKDPIEQIHIDDFGNYGKPSYYEVIGNIHDNPELLEGGVEECG